MNITMCETVRQYLLAAGWDAEGRQQAAAMLRHAEDCAECRSAIGDFDRIRATLADSESDLAEPAGGWEAMHDRMSDALAERAMPMRRPVVRPGLAIAAALAAVAAATFHIGRFLNPAPPAPTAMVQPVYLVDPQRAEPAPARISSAEESHELQAFRQVADVYDGRAGWIMLSNSSDASDVGMLSPDSRPSNKLLLLRLDLWHGHDLVSNSDLLVLAGQTADLTVPLETGQSLHYHVRTSSEVDRDDGSDHVFIALELNPPKSRNPLAALATNLLLHPNQRTTAGWLATSAGDFELKIECKEAELGQRVQ